MKYFNTFNRGLTLVSLVLIFMLSGSNGNAQCLEKDLVSLNLNNSGELEIDLSNYSGDLTSYEVRLYNYETTNDFISVNLEEAQGANIEFSRSKKKLILNGIPAGDYLVIFENNACQNIYVGEGFSGFPNSGIRIE
ncbi:hypothetical protein [Marivirga harenae]|uniref:hypothetical protein n=1 Tax=Marivirga harenae TaxID=2010992 RepID=UPI0026E0DCF8|nr:hypothetical protein [Marivirga harenae]WKV10944.1 hypothetical protein Q3Y49_12045 [Marivirga harenae]